MRNAKREELFWFISTGKLKKQDVVGANRGVGRYRGTFCKVGRDASLDYSRFYWRKKKGCSKRSDEHWVLANPAFSFGASQR